MPVILLVDSPVGEQILRTEGLPVHGYMRRPVDFASIGTIVRSLKQFGFLVMRSA